MKIILAIDDQKDNLTTIKAVLKNYVPNCEVITALSGMEGVRIAQEQKPDTILLDIIMPGMDGFEVCEKLKSENSTKHIPVIMLTAIKTDTESRVKGLDLGAEAFLSKPINPIELSAQVNVMLRIKAAEDKLRAEKENLEVLVEERTIDLHESEEFVKRVIASSNDCIKVLDLDGNLLSMSAGGQKLLEIDDVSIYLNKSWTDFWEGEDNEAAKEAISKAKNGKIGIFSGFSPTEKGNPKWWEIIITPINDSEGKLEKLLAISRDITRRKESEKVLRENEEKLRLVIDNSPVGVTTTDLKGCFLDINAAMCKLTGYSREEMIGNHFNQFSHPDDILENAKLFNKLIENKIDFFDLEKRYIHKSGNIVHVLVRAQLIRNLEGKAIFQTAIIEDITQRKLSEDLFKKQEARIRSIFRSAPVGIGVVSNRVIQQVNNRLCEMIGYEADELYNQNSMLLYPTKQEFDKVGKIKYEQINEYGTGTVETQLKRKDGKIIDVLLSSTPINPDDLSEGVTFTALDITKRKQSERKISESEYKFRLLADNTYDWEYWIDPEGNYIYLSQACQRITGYSTDEFQKNPELLFNLVHPDYNEKVYAHYNSEIEKQNPIFNLEFPIIHRTGEVRWIEHNCTPVFSTENVFLGRRGNNRDITERKKADEDIRKLSTAVEQSPSVIVITGTTGNIEYANPKFSEITGYSNAELVGQNPRILKSGEQSGKFYKAFWRTVSAGKEWHGEFHNKKKNGELFWESASISPIFDSQGKIINYIKVAEDITERKKIQEALQESQQQLKLIIDKIPGLLAFVDANEKYLYVNIAYADLYGIRRKNFIGKSLKEILPAVTYQNAKENFKMVLSGKETINENIIPGEDGSKKYILAKNIPHFDENGKVIAFLITIENITERKRSEQVQKVLYNISQAAFTSLNIEDLITIVQKELGAIIDTTNFYIAFYDEKTDAFSSPYVSDERDDTTTWPAGKSLSSYVVNTGKSLLATKEDVKKMRAAGGVISIGEPSEVWLGVPVMIEGVAKGVFAVQSYTNQNAYTIQDLEIFEFVASHISTLLDKKKAEQTLKDSEERFKLLSTLTFEGILLHDNGIAIDLNLAAAKMFGYKYEELIGKNIFTLLVAKDYRKVVAEHTKENYSLPYEIESVRKDGTHFPLEIEGRNVILTAENKTIRVTALRDITARKKAQAELNAAYLKATESDRLKSAFLATMSHELRTPLNAIIGFSEFLNKDLPVEDVVNFGQIINSSGEHLLSIVNDLFDITLIESGETKVRNEETSLKSVFYDVKTVIEAKKKRDDKKEVELVLVFSDKRENFSFNTDANKIKQILINLLKNALKFTHEGHIKYGCDLITEDKKQFLKFYVNDTGIGIENDKKEIIFDIFRQADDTHTRSYGGTGIGLSVARRLTEALGGRIWLESEVGIGSTFYFTIPVEKSENVSQFFEKENEILRENGSKTILIVEDDLLSYKFIEVLLSKLEINFIWAKNGQEAIFSCKENPEIDLVLMDMNMPVLNGYLATNEIKKFLPDLPIIAQTAFAIAGDREKTLNAGCDDYITKPINKDELIRLIEKYI